VLVRICEGLGAPRGYMGLSYDEVELSQEVSEEMKRRALMAAGSITLFGSPILGEVLHIPVRPQTPTPLPSRLGASDVAAMRSLTESLRTVARTYGGGAEVITGVAHRSSPLYQCLPAIKYMPIWHQHSPTSTIWPDGHALTQAYMTKHGPASQRLWILRR
jgi:hypothetical protein